MGWKIDEFDVPPTVSGVVLSRVAALPQPARELLDTLSAFSSRVQHDLLAEAAGLPQPEFLRAADELLSRDLVNETELPDGISFDVAHPLIRRTVYDQLGAMRRRMLHSRIVKSMERCFGNDADAHATELSYHCVRTGGSDVVAKGWRYLVTAGRDALARHADREAAAYLQHAVDSIDGENVVELLDDLARARQRLGEYDAARELWNRLRERLRADGDHAGLARVERRLGLLAVLEGDVDQALGRFAESLSSARSAARPDLEVSTLLSMSLALANAGRMEDAAARVREALGLVEASGDLVQRARLERALLELYTFTGPAHVAMDYSERAVAHARESGDRALVWSAHWATAVLAGVTANGDLCIEHAREAEAIARELNSPGLSAHADEVLIEFASAKGDWGEALRVAERAIPVARAVAPRTLAPRILVWMGTVLLNRDDVEGARAAFDEAWELSSAEEKQVVGSAVHALIVAHIGRASLHFARREWAASIDYAQRGIELGDRHGIIAWSVHRLLGILAEAAWHERKYELMEFAAARLRRDAPRLGHRLGLLLAEAIEVFVGVIRNPGPEAIPVLLDIAERGEAMPYVFHAASTGAVWRGARGVDAARAGGRVAGGAGAVDQGDRVGAGDFVADGEPAPGEGLWEAGGGLPVGIGGCGEAEWGGELAVGRTPVDCARIVRSVR